MPNPVFSALARFVPLRSVAAGRWKRPSDGKTWEFSTIFGAAAVALGGYHLAMRESQRFKTRWLPSRAASNSPPGRWPGR